MATTTSHWSGLTDSHIEHLPHHTPGGLQGIRTLAGQLEQDIEDSWKQGPAICMHPVTLKTRTSNWSSFGGNVLILWVLMVLGCHCKEVCPIMVRCCSSCGKMCSNVSHVCTYVLTCVRLSHSFSSHHLSEEALEGNISTETEYHNILSPLLHIYPQLPCSSLTTHTLPPLPPEFLSKPPPPP